MLPEIEEEGVKEEVWEADLVDEVENAGDLVDVLEKVLDLVIVFILLEE